MFVPYICKHGHEQRNVAAQSPRMSMDLMHVQANACRDCSPRLLGLSVVEGIHFL